MVLVSRSLPYFFLVSHFETKSTINVHYDQPKANTFLNAQRTIFLEEYLTELLICLFQGKLFINQSTACQTSMLLPVYESYTARCGDIVDQGIASILYCSRREYNGMDFCNFIRENTEAHSQMMELEQVSRLVSLRSPSYVVPFLFLYICCIYIQYKYNS